MDALCTHCPTVPISPTSQRSSPGSSPTNCAVSRSSSRRSPRLAGRTSCASAISSARPRKSTSCAAPSQAAAAKASSAHALPTPTFGKRYGRRCESCAQEQTPARPRPADALAPALDAAEREKPGYTRFLHDLLQAEVTATEQRRLDGRMRFAKLPTHKTLEQFDFDAQPTLDRRLVEDLATLRFVQEKANVLLIG